MRESPLNEPTIREPAKLDWIIPGLRKKTLDSMLADSVDQVLGELLGRGARAAIYDYLERNYLISRDDIPKNIEKFLSMTQSLFGNGSRTIARCVMKRLWEQLGWKFVDVGGFEFSDYLEAARTRLAKEVLDKATTSWAGQ